MARQEYQSEADRGRFARRPREIPRRGWKDIFFRVKEEVAKDNLSMIAAGVTFYVFLSIFPALAALVALYGLVTDPADLQEHIKTVEAVLPGEAAQLLNQELSRLVQSQGQTLGWSLVVSILIALWSAAKGMKSMFESMNVAYDEEEKRGFLKLNGMALLLTLAGIVFLILFLGLIVGVPALLASVPFGHVAAALLKWLRWPLLAVAGMFALAILYRYGPSRDKPRWRWISWGTVIATVIWLLGSALFSFYVSHFASYNATYGSLGVVVILMMWLLLSVYSILLGAEINAEIEHQTLQDTTEGGEQPMGRRGAHVADTVGERS
ncbi:MAG TPA: YihY/virulence factor BrkB family protein [Candidatus Eisenbacteria bacterium]|nr:YihY/virulence factor BrkB family protein [Candidatus Eisenbacteria bacterium]